MNQKFLSMIICILVSACGSAQILPCLRPTQDEPVLGIKTLPLWEGSAPLAKGAGCNDIPTLTLFDSDVVSTNGSAVIILPGGAYTGLSLSLEGRQVADWFVARGFKAFLLKYRLGSHGYLLPVPLIDARRAVQMVRARSAEFKINPNRIVMIGFSAGGHLAALAGTQPLEANPQSQDPLDRVSSKPNYLVLAYPWIGALSSDTSHLSYCKLFNVMDRCEELRKAYSPDLFVSKDTPRTFWYHTFDDHTVPLEQGLRFYQALIKAGVPSEAHIFPRGEHGSGLGKGDVVLDKWPDLLETWLRAQGLMSPPPAVDDGER